MKYNPKTKSIEISQNSLDLVYHSLIYAMRNIRELAGLPLDKYKHDGPLTTADHAQKGILDAAKEIGLVMGAEWGEDLDLRPE